MERISQKYSFVNAVKPCIYWTFYMFYGIFFVINLLYNAKKREWSRNKLFKNKVNISQTSEYKNNYQKINYDRVTFFVNKGKKEEFKEHCNKFGYKSLNSFVNEAVQEKIQKDLDNNTNNL